MKFIEGLRAAMRGAMSWMALGMMTVAILTSMAVQAQGVITTTVQGTVYLANGQPGAGTLVVRWPAFNTNAGQAVTAGSLTVQIAADGFVSVSLAPNQGSIPAGGYYTAVFYMSDGTTSTEYWLVPASVSATLAQVRAQVMPAAQAVQAASKAYVDESISQLSQTLLASSGGSVSGSLYLNGDPTQALQAADKHYVDAQVATALPLSGGVMAGPLMLSGDPTQDLEAADKRYVDGAASTAVSIATNAWPGQVLRVENFPGADFGAELQACVNAVSASYGGTCDARNFSGNLSMGANLTISNSNTTVLLPCATITTANQMVIAAGTRNVALRGCALRGGSAGSGSAGGTAFAYSGSGAMIQVGDPTYGVDTPGFHMDNAVINTTAATSALAQGMVAFRTQELDLESLYLLGNANQTGMTLDGTGNYTGGTFLDVQISGFQTAVNAIGHQAANGATTDWLNASTFVRVHINCPTSGGSPIAGTYGINLQQGDGNTFTGGDVEGCATALHLGPNAQNNTIVGLRNENSTKQVVADAGSSYNSWITGGTMFTGQLTDNGTRNSFLDTFHRSFNELNGDWYGSQQDATVTNHYRLGIGTGNERGLQDRYQADSGYRWTMGLSDATGGEQYYQILDELNNVYRFSIGQYNRGQGSTNNQTVINAAGTGAVVLNGSNGAGTGGVVVGSGGSNSNTVATISNAGNAQFNGTLQVSGTTQSTGTMTVRNNSDAEVDYYLWPGLTASQKGSFTYKDWNGNSQWYLLKDASNNWAINSAIGGLDSFKAYQSTNSGDTYVNASNSSGVVRVNYESGAGTGFKVYGGNSSTLYASFTGSSAIAFPGLAAASGHNCLQIDNSGYVTSTGSACAGGSGGSVSAGNTGQIAYYTGNGTAIGGMNAVPVTAGGTGATSAAAGLANLGAQATMPGVASDGSNGLNVTGNIAATGINGGNGTYSGSVTASSGKFVSLQLSGAPWFDVTAYGAVGDAAVINGISIASGTSTITGGSCVAANVGKEVQIPNALSGSGTLVATVSSCTGSSFNLSASASATVTSGYMALGTDSTAAIQAATDAVIARGVLNGVQNAPAGVVYLPPGTYLTSGTISTCHYNGCPAAGAVPAGTINVGIVLEGAGRGASTLLSETSNDMIDLYTWSAPSVVENLYFGNGSGKGAIALHVRGNGQSIRRNWMMANQAIYLETTATIATSTDSIDDVQCDSNDVGGGGDCVTIARTSGTDPSPNNIHISNLNVYGGNSGVITNGAYGVTIRGLECLGQGSYCGSFMNSSDVNILGGYLTGTNTNSFNVESGFVFSNSSGSVSGATIRNFQQNAIQATNGSSVIVSGVTMKENVQSAAAPNPYDLFASQSTLTMVGGNIENSTGHPTTAIEMEGAGNGVYKIEGVSISGSAYTGTTVKGISGAGGITSIQLLGNTLTGVNSTGGGNPTILIQQVTGGLTVSGNIVTQAGTPTNWLSSTYVNSNNCFSSNVSNAASSILLNGVRLQGFSEGCYNGATPYSQYSADTIYSNNGYYNGRPGANNVVIPAAATGYHGASGTKVQLSDGTGTSGACFFAGDGSCTASAGTLQNGVSATTQVAGDNSTKVATTGYVDTKTVGAGFGGTGINSSASTGVAQVNGGTWSISTAIANGITATTQAGGDNSAKIATTAYVASPGAISPTTVTASGIVAGGNDTTRTTSTTASNGWTTTGLVLPAVPVSTTKSGHCTIFWQMSSTSYTATFGLGMNNAPTNVWGGSRLIYAAAGTSNWLAFTQSSTSTTAISAATTAGVASTTYAAQIDFVIQTGATNPVAMTIYGQTSNGSATLTIMPGSTCYWLP